MKRLQAGVQQSLVAKVFALEDQLTLFRAPPGNMVMCQHAAEAPRLKGQIVINTVPVKLGYEPAKERQSNYIETLPPSSVERDTIPLHPTARSGLAAAQQAPREIHCTHHFLKPRRGSSSITLTIV